MAGFPTPRDALGRYVRVQQANDRKVLALLRQAKRDLDRQLKEIVGDGVGAAVRRDQVRLARAAVLERTAQVLRDVGDLVQAGKIEAGVAADRNARDYDRVLAAGGRDDARVRAYLDSAIQTSRTAVELAERRLFGTAYIPLSQQVYRTGVVTSGLLDSAVNSAIARGLSAREFAREMVGFVNPDTPGGASYAAMRLARTELNRAFHAKSVDNARERPWVSGMLWSLSSSHPKPDVCDDYAEHDDGHGVGVYAVDDVPEKPHPHDLCVVTEVDAASYDDPKTGKGRTSNDGSSDGQSQDPEDAWLDAFLDGDYDDYIDGRIAAAEATDRARKRG